MIQIILKDGTKFRYTKKPKAGWIGFTDDDIQFQKELTEEEILKIPIVKKGKLEFVETTPEIESAKLEISRKNEIEKLIEAKKRQLAVDELILKGDISKDDLKLVER